MTQTSTKPTIITTGLNGLVGSRFALDFGNAYTLINLDLTNPTSPIDITDFEQVNQVFAQSNAKVVVHLAAFTDVTRAWAEKGDTDGTTYRVNVGGTENIVKAAEQNHVHIIHISTAYVFDGNQDRPYLESDTPNPIEWYGETKYLAEKVVNQATVPWTIFRIDQPFRTDPFPKLDIVHRIAAGLTQGNLPPQFTNHHVGPTFINDFAKVLDWAIRTEATGLYHASSGESWTDYDLALLIKETHQLGGEVQPGNLDDYLQKLNRPYQRNTVMSCDTLKQALDFELTPISKAVAQVTLE